GPLFRRKNKTHTATRHPAEHPKTPRRIIEFSAHALNQRLSEIVRSPRNDGLNRLLEISRGRRSDVAHVALSQRQENPLENAQHALARLPFGLRSQQILFGNLF